MKQSDFCNVDRSVPIGQRRVYQMLFPGGSIIDNGILPGDYLLKDNRFSASTEYGMEKGILIGQGHLFVEIASLSPKLMQRSEAMAYAAANCWNLPEKEQLQVLNDCVEAVNNSLKHIGKEDCLLPQNVVDGCWHSGMRKGTLKRRRVVLIRQVLGMNVGQVPPIRLSGSPENRTASEEIFLTHQNFADSFWVLQMISPGYYFVLEDRIITNEMHPNDNTLNGQFHFEGDCLVIENPTHSFNGSYVKTFKAYYRKDVHGLYRRIGENWGEWRVRTDL